MKDNLLKIYAQVKDLFLSMTPGNRIIASLLLATLLISLGYLIVGSIKRSDPQSNTVFLYNGRSFDSNEQKAVEEALGKANLKSHDWVGDKLQVPRSSAATYLSTIATANAVNNRGRARTETTKNFTPWESAKMQDTKWIESTARDIADGIAEMDGVASAMVIPNKRREWDKNVWARKDIFSVSVLVDSTFYKPLPDNTISAIGQLVAGAFGIHDMKEIRIVDSRNSRSYNGLGVETNGGGTSYLKEQVRFQEIWKDKIYNILPHIQGLQVETSVDLTKKINENIFEVDHYKPKAPLTEHVRGTDFLKEEAARFGRPGQIAQMSRPLIDPQAGQAERARTTEKTHEREITNPLSGKEDRYEMIPFTPERILASLQIPWEHVRATWKQKNLKPGEATTEPTPEELQLESEQIRTDTRRIVAKLLEPYRDPRSRDASPLDMVEVIFYDPIREAEVVLSGWEKFKIWFGLNWQSLALMGMVLCGLCVLWTITKPAKPEPIVIYEAPEIPLEVFEAHAQAKAEAEAAAAEDEDDMEFSRTLDGFDKSIRSLQEEISELVEENPDAAAAVLRQWIGNAVLVEAK